MAAPETGTTAATDFLGRLQAHCDIVDFPPGALLREKGLHYTSMYLVTDGQIEVDLDMDGSALRPQGEERGLPIGEIGFLRGFPANATVSAISDVRALEITDDVLTAIEARDPSLAVDLLRFLATTADERTSQNITLAQTLDNPPKEQSIRVLLCRDNDMLHEAKHLRYAVYCEELGRQSPHADHTQKIITDDLDDFGQTFIAVEDGQTIGTLRANRPSEGAIGILATLYGMDASDFHPHSTIICTKFIIAPDKRSTTAGIKLVAGFARYGVQNEIRECYIDCIPSLRAFYMGMGFRKSAEKFLHRENGPSFPMKIDLVKYKGRIDRVLSTVS